MRVVKLGKGKEQCQSRSMNNITSPTKLMLWALDYDYDNMTEHQTKLPKAIPMENNHTARKQTAGMIRIWDEEDGKHRENITYNSDLRQLQLQQPLTITDNTFVPRSSIVVDRSGGESSQGGGSGGAGNFAGESRSPRRSAKRV